MALGHKYKKSYRELVLKRESVKMQVHGKSRSQIGPWWTFFTDGQFLPIPCELVFIFDKITYYLCLICNGREREVGGGGRLGGEITSFRKTSSGKSFEVFFLRFRHFFHMKCFPDQNYIAPTKKPPCRKVCPPNTSSKDKWFMLKNLYEWHSIR